MDSIHDLGGMQGFGPAPAVRRDEPVFGEPWEGRAFGLSLLSMRLSGTNLPAFRHAMERLDPLAYLGDGYYGRWLNGAENLLVDSDILAPGAVDARARQLQGEQVAEPPVPEPRKPDYQATAAGSIRQVDAQPRFAAGDRVRARDVHPRGHTRLPRYVRGRTGTVEALQRPELLPDTHAHFQGENAQHLYSVRFDSRELWGEDAEPFSLSVDLFEQYLEPAS
jgi:nitrile hydratase subunit beta